MNWYKNHTVYEFVLYNLYNNVWIRLYEFVQKLVKKRFISRLGFQPGTKMACNCRIVKPSTIHHPTASVSAHFIYIPHTIRTPSEKGMTICHTNEFVQSQFSDGVLFSYSTVYKKNGHWRRGRGGGWQSPGWNPIPDANLFFANFCIQID